MSGLEICYLPAQWRALEEARLRDSTCVVIDVIRWTSTLLTALANGASSVWPVGGVEEAFALKGQNPAALLAGERGGQALPGFDLGNSPREMTAAHIGGRALIMTTTNGTQALTACRGSRAIVAASLLNLEAVAARLRENGPPWIIVCAGFEGGFGIDDAIVAGALAEALDQDHALVSLYRSVKHDLTGALLGSSAGRELAKVGLEADVPACAELNRLPFVPTVGADGRLRLA
jgi:2-phosphosulfolactate phosphatase